MPSINDIRASCDTIESLRPLQSVRPDVVAEETLKALASIIRDANQMRDAMLEPAHRAGLTIRHMARVSDLSHVTVGKRLAAGQDDAELGE